METPPKPLEVHFAEKLVENNPRLNFHLSFEQIVTASKAFIEHMAQRIEEDKP